MITTTVEEDNVTVVYVVGRIELYDEPDSLKWPVNAALGHDRKHIVINLEHVSSVDRAGLGVLESIGNIVAKQGGQLGVVGANSVIADLFATTKLDRFIKLHPDLASALASFTPEPETV